MNDSPTTRPSEPTTIAEYLDAHALQVLPLDGAAAADLGITVPVPAGWQTLDPAQFPLEWTGPVPDLQASYAWCQRMASGHYENFLKLQSESEYLQMSYAEKRKKEKDFGRFIKSVKKQLGDE